MNRIANLRSLPCSLSYTLSCRPTEELLEALSRRSSNFAGGTCRVNRLKKTLTPSLPAPLLKHKSSLLWPPFPLPADRCATVMNAVVQSSIRLHSLCKTGHGSLWHGWAFCCSLRLHAEVGSRPPFVRSFETCSIHLTRVSMLRHALDERVNRRTRLVTIEQPSC